MRIDSIATKNYRQYRDMLLEFPATKPTDIHVLVASNGIGKTNLLNAINWCFYGDEPHLGNSSDALSICNLTALQENKTANIPITEVSVIITLSAGEEKFIFTRKVPVNSNTGFQQHDEFSVRVIDKNGESNIKSGQDADELVSQLLPKKIRQYFFFDGEQLFNYFGKGSDTSHVKDSIHEIAQISVVTGARSHLDTLIAEYQSQIGKMNPQVDEFTAELKSKEDAKQHYLLLIDQLEKAVIENEEIIAEMSAKIAGTESVVEANAQYELHQARLEECKMQKGQMFEQLKALVRKYYVLVMMFDTNTKTKAYIDERYAKGALPPSIDIRLVRESLEKHECALCKSTVSPTAEVYLKDLLQRFELSTSVSHKLMEIKNDVNRLIDNVHKFQSEKASLFEKIQVLDEEMEKLNAEVDRLYKIISTCSSTDEIKKWMDQRQVNREMRDANNQTIGKYRGQVELLDNDISSLRDKIATAMEQMNQGDALRHELAFAQEARSILLSIENETTADVRSRMEKETKFQFDQLIWKKNTYGRIELTYNYQVRLYHKITGESCLGSCSAAERELLALAFTIALHKVSGHDGLLFIDTPVGRVSDVNRENFAQSLINVSEYKQLILAFTPSEFSEEIQKYFREELLSSKIELHSAEEISIIKGE